MRLLPTLFSLSLLACSSEASRGPKLVPMPEDCETRTTPGPFDRGCAAKTLVDAALASRRCGPLPPGGAHVKMTFASTGHAETAEVDSPRPFDAVIGACIEETFRQARVPPFPGGPIKVGKTLAP